MSTMKTRPWRQGVLLLALLLAGCKVDLYSRLTESEANEMMAALATQHVSATKVDHGEEGWQVQVEQHEVPVALEALRAQGLPRERFVSLGDMFKKQGLVSTPAEERMRYIHGLSQELSRTLQTIDGVIAARVHVVIPANDPLSDRIRPSSAAVFIKHAPGIDLKLLEPTVKDMVAHSIEGLDHDKVSLTVVEAQGPRVVARPAAGAGRVSLLDWGSDDPTGSSTRVLAWVLAIGVVSVASWPWLLKRRGVDWRTWVQRLWRRP